MTDFISNPEGSKKNQENSEVECRRMRYSVDGYIVTHGGMSQIIVHAATFRR